MLDMGRSNELSSAARANTSGVVAAYWNRPVSVTKPV